MLTIYTSNDNHGLELAVQAYKYKQQIGENMKSQYIRYETGAAKNLRPLSIPKSNNIKKATDGQLLAELYNRHSIFVWQVLATLAWTWMFVNKLR